MNYAVILAGGSGKRLWPLSRQNRPKQLISVFDGNSLLGLCVDRIKDIFPPENILIVTNQEYADVIDDRLTDIPSENIISEPIGRNTANAIGLAATVLSLRDPKGIMAVFSADQIIEPIEPLQEAVRTAINFLQTNPNALFTFGIKATSANIGYGYLKRGEVEAAPGVSPVEAFKEKPNRNTARQYIRSGQYCWNSGIFAWRIDTILRQLDRFIPHNADRLKYIGEHWDKPERLTVLDEEFRELEKISIDYAVMERAADVFMCELDCHWQDVGSYQALAENIGAVGEEGNISTDDTAVKFIGSGNNLVISDSPKHFIAAIHVEDLIIAHTKDATLVCHRDETEQLKRMLEEIEKEGYGDYV